jgi:predicted esterase
MPASYRILGLGRRLSTWAGCACDGILHAHTEVVYASTMHIHSRLRFLALVGLPLTLLAGCGDDTADTTGQSTTTDTGGGGGSGGDAGGGGTGGDPTAHTSPDPMFVPEPTGACPELAQGTITVSPDGKARDVRIWMSEAAAAQDGPIVFFWHGVGGSPEDASYALGSTVMDEIAAMGGIVAAPVHDPAAGQFPWYLTLGGSDESDLRVMDEVLACAIEKVGVDLRRIHSVGFSAGAMNTTQVGWRRSGYVASVVTFSGAQFGSPPEQDPNNLYPAMVVHGGPQDVVVINFKDNSEKYAQILKEAGHFAFLCDHGQEHTIPADIRAPAWQFLKDHPFGEQPEPYQGGLPTGFPSYCSL